ncbi:MAG: hypothetical protein Aureis2KO_21880 [Aureisphaera sp.]
MSQYHHCALCEHEQKSLKDGLTCGLTNKKPTFENTCSYIKLDGKFQNKIEAVTIELERIRRKKYSIHLTYYFLISVGFLLIAGNKKLAELFHSTMYFWLYQVEIIGVGITILSIAFAKLNSFRNKLKIANWEKYKIDSALEKYGISYKANIVFEKKFHGMQPVNVSIIYKNWTKKRSETTVMVH